MKRLNVEFLPKSVSKFFRSIALETMKVRAEQNTCRTDMIQLLMNGRAAPSQYDDKSNNLGVPGKIKPLWTDGEIGGQCFLFYISGFNTSSTALMFTAYELAVNAHVQERVYEEIVEAELDTNGKYLDYENLGKLKYLDQVLSESLRKWPPGMLAFTDRLCTKDYTFENNGKWVTIEKGHVVWIPVYAFHRDPEFFPDPEVFDPDRFSDKNKGNIKLGTYIPFGVGPRICIASRFSLMEMKLIFYYLIKNFKFEPNEKTQAPLKFKKHPFNVPQKGVHVTFRPRNI